MEAPRCGSCGSFMELFSDRGNTCVYECCGRTVAKPKDGYDAPRPQNVR